MCKKYLVLISILLMLIASGCNRQVVDTILTYNEVILQLPNGEVISGEVQTWRDYEDGDQIQVKVDGVVYLVHSSDIVLIRK